MDVIDGVVVATTLLIGRYNVERETSYNYMAQEVDEDFA